MKYDDLVKNEPLDRLVGITTADVFQDTAHHRHVGLDLVKIESDVVEVLEDRGIARLLSRHDPGEKESHLLEFRARKPCVRVLQTEEKLNGGNLPKAEIPQDPPHLADHLRSMDGF